MPATILAALSPLVVVLVGSGDLDSRFRPYAADTYPTVAACTPDANRMTALADGLERFRCLALPPCRIEDDGTPCHWNAATRGNGTGTSFVHMGGGLVAYFR